MEPAARHATAAAESSLLIGYSPLSPGQMFPLHVNRLTLPSAAKAPCSVPLSPPLSLPVPLSLPLQMVFCFLPGPCKQLAIINIQGVPRMKTAGAKVLGANEPPAASWQSKQLYR